MRMGEKGIYWGDLCFDVTTKKCNDKPGEPCFDASEENCHNMVVKLCNKPYLDNCRTVSGNVPEVLGGHMHHEEVWKDVLRD